MNETEFEQRIVDLAHVFGWRAVGHRPMRTKHGWATGWKYDGVGFPDLLLTHADRGRVVFAELKIPPNHPSPEQEAWADHLLTVSEGVEIDYRLWTPADWADIQTLLSHGRII